MPGKNGKTPKKQGNPPREKKKQGIQKKQGKEGQGKDITAIRTDFGVTIRVVRFQIAANRWRIAANRERRFKTGV